MIQVTREKFAHFLAIHVSTSHIQPAKLFLTLQKIKSSPRIVHIDEGNTGDDSLFDSSLEIPAQDCCTHQCCNGKNKHDLPDQYLAPNEPLRALFPKDGSSEKSDHSS
jgi:hypothetical protein